MKPLREATERQKWKKDVGDTYERIIFLKIETCEFEMKPNFQKTHAINSRLLSAFPKKFYGNFTTCFARNRSGKLFGYVQCDDRVPDKLKDNFVTFSPVQKIELLFRSNNGDFVKAYAEESNLLTQPRRLLITIFHLANGTMITLALKFYLDLGIECTQPQCFAQYTRVSCFSRVFRSAVVTGRQFNEN